MASEFEEDLRLVTYLTSSPDKTQAILFSAKYLFESLVLYYVFFISEYSNSRIFFPGDSIINNLIFSY